MLAVVIIALGVAMVLGGATCIGLGAPYLVLEHGFTLTIIGTVLASAGVLLIATGLVLRELRRLAARLATRGDSEAAQPPAGGAAGAAVLGAGLAGAGIAAAGIADAGTALASADPTQADVHVDPASKTNVPEAASLTEITGELMQAPEPAGGDLDAQGMEHMPEDPLAGATAEDMPPGQGEPPVWADMPAPTGILQGEPEEEDPFERLRRSLLEGRAQSATSLAVQTDVAEPVPEPAPLPYQPSMTDDASSGEAAQMQEPAEADAAPTDEAGTGKTGPDETGPDEIEANEASGPAVSEEGIISVRRIGDATYTMFADGTVLAETPRGARRFASVADLKAHLSAGGA